MARHNVFGRTGEELARVFLEKSGYEILEENWTYGKCEIDLIAYKDRQLIFIEVKSRSGNSFGEPEDFVNSAKRRQMTLAANEYIYLMDHQGEVRFDVIAILIDPEGKPALRHIEDAFWPE